MPIQDLELKNVGLFEEISFQFDPHINVFIGPNNCGKSTVLTALGNIAVYPFDFPEKLLRKEEARFTTHIPFSKNTKALYQGILPIKRPLIINNEFDHPLLKSIGYSCLIPALRGSTSYRSKSPVPDKLDENILKLETEYSKRATLIRTNASMVEDKAIIQRIIELDYKFLREEKPENRKLIGEIATLASEITEGFPIEFIKVDDIGEGLFLEFMTPDGKMPLNALSQGTQSIIQWLGILLLGYAQYYDYPKNLEKKPGVVIIDEIDAHLHPSWQRRILPTLSKHFPNLQIFCASHSPMVLAGLKAGQVQLLKRDAKGKVTVSRNETDIVGWSTDEILRNFLDIANPTDQKTNDDIERLAELRKKKRLTKKEKVELEKLRDSVNQNILSGPGVREIDRFLQTIREDRSEYKTPSKKKTVAKKAKKPSTPKKPRALSKKRRGA